MGGWGPEGGMGRHEGGRATSLCSIAMPCNRHGGVFWLPWFCCCQMEAAGSQEREVVFSLCPLSAGQFVLFVEYLSPAVTRSAIVVIEARRSDVV
jgi:hypothetical protein